MSPDTLFDLPEQDLMRVPPGEHVRHARTEAIQRVDTNANPDWKTIAYNAVIDAAALHDDFTADDVWALLEAQPDVSTHEPAALGPVMLRAVREGRIVATGSYRPSVLARRHRDLKIWRQA